MSSEEGLTLEAPGLTWGLRTSFLLYLARMPQTEVSVGDGAGYTMEREFWFPLSDDEEPSSSPANDRTLRFEGEVSIVAHSGFLRLTVADPWVEHAGGGRRGSARGSAARPTASEYTCSTSNGRNPLGTPTARSAGSISRQH